MRATQMFVKRLDGGVLLPKVARVHAVGRRPLTPDGLPILDRVHPFESLFIATGHSMLGITLAPASGQAMAGYVLSGTRPELLEPFRLRRFAATR